MSARRKRRGGAAQPSADATADAREPATAPRRRNRLRVVAWSTLVLAVLASLVWSFRDRTLAPLVRMAARAQVAEQLGLELEVDSFGGDWLHTLELTGVRVSALDERGELRAAQSRSVTIEFDAWEALRGETGWLRRVEVHDARVDVDLGAPPRSEPTPSSSNPLVPERWPAIDLFQVSGSLRLDAQRALDFESVVVRLGASDERSSAACDASVKRFEFVGDWPLAPRRASVVAHGALSGQRLELASLQLKGDFELANGRAVLDLANARAGGVAFEAAGAGLGGTMAVRGEVEPASFTLSFDTERVDLPQALDVFGVDATVVSSGAATLRGELVAAEDGVWLGLRGDLVDACLVGRPIETLTVDGVWSPRELWLAALDARSGDNQLRARSVRAPRGSEGWLRALRDARGDVELLARDVPTLVGADPSSAPPHLLEFAGELDESGLSLRSGALRTLRGALRVERGSVAWGGDDDGLEDARLDLALRVQFEDLGPLGALLGDTRWSGSCAGSAHVSGAANDPIGALDLTGEGVVVGALQLGAVRARAQLSGGRLDVERLESSGALGELELRGVFDTPSREILDASLSCSTDDLTQFARSVGLPEVESHVVGGALQLRAHGHGAWLDPDGDLSISVRNVTQTGGRTIDDARLLLQRVRERWTIGELSARSGEFSARVSGALVHARGAPQGLALVDEIEVSDGAATLELVRPAMATYSADSLRTSRMELAGSAGGIEGEVRWAPDEARVELAVAEFEPLALFAPFLPADASFGPIRGELALSLDGGGWGGRADLSATGASWGAAWPTVDVELHGSASSREFDVDQLIVDGADAGRVVLGGQALIPAGDWTELLRTDGRLFGNLDRVQLARWPWREMGLELDLRGALRSSFDVALSSGEPRGRVRIDGEDLVVRSFDGRLGAAEEEISPAKLVLDATLGSELVIERCEVDAPGRARMSMRGRLGGIAAWLSSGTLAPPGDALVFARASWAIDDLGWLAPFSSVIRRVEGAAAGAVTLAGTWNDPRANGEWSWTNGALRLGADAPPFERVNGRGTIDGARLTLASLAGELGAGPFEIAGLVDFADGGRYALKLVGRELLVLRERDLRARADVDLALSGPFDAPLLSGRIGVRDGRWRQRIEWLPSAPAPVVARRGGELPFTIRSSAVAELRYDVAIESAGEFLIDTNLAKINLRPELRLGGKASAPTLGGAVYLDPSRVTLPGSTLDLRAGVLQFDPYASTTPTVDITATTRVLGYDINARLSGRIDDLQRDLTSTPPLRSEDISVLLLTGRPPRDVLSNESGAEAAQTVIVFLGKDLLSSWIGGDASLMERVEWRAGSDATRAGGSTAQVSVRVLGPATGEGAVMYLRGEKDVYDRINYGVRWLVRMK